MIIRKININGKIMTGKQMTRKEERGPWRKKGRWSANKNKKR